MGSSKRWIIIWEVVALIALILAVSHLSLPLLDGLLMRKEPREIVIRINVQEAGGFEPDEITVKKGEKVRLKLISMDMPHSFVAHKLNIKSELIIPGGDPVVIEFTPKEASVIEFQCGVTCSPKHLSLTGKLIVVGDK